MLKKRNWAFILYEDSAPENWREMLYLKGLCCAISPYHDNDINPTGERKKPHYHIILCFTGPVTYNTVCGITDEFNATIPQPLESVVGYYRYLTHKDNPDKAQYKEEDIQLINGFDATQVLNSMEVFNILKNIHIMIMEKDIREYNDLLEYLMSEDLGDYYNVASTHTLFLNTLLTSRRHKLEKQKEKVTSLSEY